MATLIDKYSIEKMIDRYQKELDQLFAEQEAGKKSKLSLNKPIASGGITVPEGDYRTRQGNSLVGDEYLNTKAAVEASPFQFVDYGIGGNNKFSNADGSGRQPFNLGNAANSFSTLAPVLYNLGMGLNKAEQFNPVDFYNPRRREVASLMHNRRTNVQPQLDSILEAQRIANYNIGNAGGSYGNIQGNLGAVANNAMRNRSGVLANKQNMDLNYMGQEAEMLYGLGQGEAGTKFNIADYNLQNLASRRNFTGTSMGQLSQYAQNQQLMANQATRDKQLAGIYPDMFKSVMPFMTGVQDLIASLKLKT